MHCGLAFSDNEDGLDFSDFDEDDDEDDEDDSDSDDSDDMNIHVLPPYLEHVYSNSDDGRPFPLRLAFGPDDEEQMFDRMRGEILWDDEADDDDSESDDEDEDDEEEDSFIDQRSETEILEGGDFDDTDLSIYHTRENNYYSQADSATDHPDSDNADDEEEDEQMQPSPARRSRRLQRSRIDTDDESEGSSETVREAESDELSEQPSSSSQQGPATRSRGRPPIYVSDED